MKLIDFYRYFYAKITSLQFAIALILFIALILIALTMTALIGQHESINPALKNINSMFSSGIPYIMIAAGTLLGFGMIVLAVKMASFRITPRRTGIIMLHLGLSVILSGYFIGMTGIDGDIQIPQGKSSQKINLKNGGIFHPGFLVKCNRFTINYNDDGSPAEFISDISFIENDKITKNSILRVNHPAQYKGFNFYQSGYECLDKAVIKAADKKNITWFEAAPGEELIRKPDIIITAGHIIPNVMNAGPAVELFVQTKNGSQTIWLLKNIRKIILRNPGFLDQHPQFNPNAIKPFVFMLEDINQTCTTVLSVRKDPGLPFIILGALMFIAGILLTFLSPLKKQGNKNGYQA